MRLPRHSQSSRRSSDQLSSAHATSSLALGPIKSIALRSRRRVKLSGGAGPWEARKEAAVRAYHEWMPTRSGTFGEPGYIGEKIWRRFDMGDLATVVALETRLTVRARSLLR